MGTSPQPGTTAHPPAKPYKTVANKFRSGRVVPFLGAGVNLADHDEAWNTDEANRPPSGGELAKHLIDKLLEGPYTSDDLLRVSQFIENDQGSGPLYLELDDVFRRDYPTTSVHQWLARLPEPGKVRNNIDRHPLIVTTNYDRLMEEAYGEANTDFDLVFYKPKDPGPGSFWHTKPGAEPEEIKPGVAQDYDYPFFEQRPGILKIHGTAHEDDQYSRYVITEDHYIQYVADRPLQNLLPRRVLTKLTRNHILYLGYSLADWNLRVFLHMVGQEPRDRFKGWAIKKCVEEDDALAWQKRKVDVLDMDLSEYVREMKQALGMD